MNGQPILPAPSKALSLKVDVFNVFSSQTVTRYTETREDHGAISRKLPARSDGRTAPFRALRRAAPVNLQPATVRGGPVTIITNERRAGEATQIVDAFPVAQHWP